MDFYMKKENWLAFCIRHIIIAIMILYLRMFIAALKSQWRKIIHILTISIFISGIKTGAKEIVCV